MKAIEIKELSKTYKIPHEKKTTIFETLYCTLCRKNDGYETFNALENIDFSVKKGEWLGIIGHNGSGKSTLLKLIAKIIRPTKGQVVVNGKITSFLELGVGFQSDLTAKDNIMIYGAIMGLPDKEIESRIDNILEFAGLTRFKDTKIKNFSSGMIARLAFSTAIQIEPEILLLDEVLAVGDLDFQHKCYEVFEKYKETDKTVIFVSHDLTSIQRFCDKVLLLNHGKQVEIGDTKKMIQIYQEMA